MSGTDSKNAISSCNTDSKPKNKRPREVNPRHLQYINKLDGKGYYLRFSMSAPYIEDIDHELHTLYEDKIIDASYIHAYNRFVRTRDGKPNEIDEKKSVCHGILHVVSRDYDFNFWRERLPKARFKISTYPDDSYNRIDIQKELESDKI